MRQLFRRLAHKTGLLHAPSDPAGSAARPLRVLLAKLGIKRVRGDTFGYLQRSFIGCVSDVDQREAREVGEKAVQFAMWGHQRGLGDGSVAIKRTGFYSVDYELLPLETVAGKTRVMEDEFIAANGTDVTDAFRLRHNPVAKVLKR